ncbi:MAG: efflux RND transporter permease subunit, partial [Deltaproteobacteria bacterium]
MSLSDVSIKNPVFAWMLMAALIIFGYVGYIRLGVSQLPDVDFPVVSVSLSWQGAAPEVMETDVVDPVESAIMGIQGLRDVSSTINQGAATVTIEFDLGRNIDFAVQEVQTKISQAQRSLPKDMDPPIVTKVNPEDQPIIWISVTGGKSLRDLIGYVDDSLRDNFTTISGVGDVFLGGFVDRNLRIWVDQNKLRQLELTANDIIQTVAQQHEEVPAGLIETPRQEFNVRVMGEAPSPEKFGDLVIQTRSGQPVYKPIYMKDVATIENGLEDIRRLSRTEGKVAVGLGIRKQRGANEVAVAQRVLKRLEEIRPSVPRDIHVDVAFNRSKFIEDSVRELIFTLVLSALVTSLVCWLFLGSWSATLNILLAIPTSVLGTFLVIYFLGFTLNTFTVLGLTLAVGIVVDDSIMVLENIVRRREGGEDRVVAALNGSNQISLAAFASTLALVAIFLPVALMSGIMGAFFFQYGVTISIAVLLSLLEALTLTPMRCSQFLSIGKRHTGLGKAVDDAFSGAARGYRKWLGRVLEHAGLVLTVSLVLFFLSLSFIGFLRKEFLPSQDQSLVLARIETPAGSSMTFTNTKFEQIEKLVMSRPEVQRYFSAIGGFTSGTVNTGFIFITLKDPAQRPVAPPFKKRPSQVDVMAFFRKEFNSVPDVKAIIQDLSLAGFSAQRGFPVEFSLRGTDWTELARYTRAMMAGMAQSGLMTDIDTDYQENVQEIRVVPDRVKASQRGVDIDAIGNTVQALVGGMPIGKFTQKGRRYDVRIRLLPTERAQAEQIAQLQAWNNRGELVNLSDVVSICSSPASLTITRRNRERAISVFANVAAGKSQTAALDEINSLAKKILPPGYRVIFTGSAQAFQESFLSLIAVFFLGILVSYMVLASQYNSYLQPLFILLALPFSITGAFIALWSGRQSINIYSLIGIILLMGIVKKNSILLVDFTNQRRREGLEVREALLEACPIRL